MKAIDEWVLVLKHAWSVRFAALSVLLTGFDIALPYLAPDHPSRVFAILAGFAAAASAAARLIIQSKMREKIDARTNADNDVAPVVEN